jgi:hypothetical protein
MKKGLVTVFLPAQHTQEQEEVRFPVEIADEFTYACLQQALSWNPP